MSEKPSSNPYSGFRFWGIAIGNGWKNSREKFGLAVDIFLVFAALGLLVIAWLSNRNKDFSEERSESSMSYWFAIIPVSLWLMWFIYHVLKAPYEIYKTQFKEHKDQAEELQHEVDLLREKLKPKFTLSCKKDITGCAITAPDGSYKFFRLRVETDCVNGIEGCKGHLIKIEKDGFTVYDHDAVELPFARAEEIDSLSKTLFPDNPYFLDVLVTHNPTNTVLFATKGHFRAWDQNQQYIFSKTGKFILTVAVSGRGVPTAITKLQFDWNGQWSNATIEKHDNKSVTKTLDSAV